MAAIKAQQLAIAFMLKNEIHNQSVLLPTLTCLYASHELTKKNIPHQIKAGSCFWRVNPCDSDKSILSTIYDTSHPTAMGAWIECHNMIFDPSIGVAITYHDGPVAWKPNYLLIHRDDTQSLEDVSMYGSGSVHYAPCDHATEQLLIAKQAFESHLALPKNLPTKTLINWQAFSLPSFPYAPC